MLAPRLKSFYRGENPFRTASRPSWRTFDCSSLLFSLEGVFNSSPDDGAGR